MKCLRALALVTCLAGCGANPAGAADAAIPADAAETDVGGEDAAVADPLADGLASLRAAHGVPALAALELRDGAITRSVAVGVRRADAADAVSTHDRWHIGSCTKAMTAALLALVAEGDGPIDLDATLADAFPDVEIHESLRDVTLAQLLVHRGGLAEDRSPTPELMELLAIEGAPREARAEVARRLLARAPAVPPGTEMRYSNFGYVLVGAALERATGTAWEDLMRAHLFEPLGMSSCGFGAPAAIHPDAPSGHVEDGGALVPVPSLDNPALLGPAGTVHCSLEDWARFVAWTMAPPTSGPLALSASARERLFTPTDDGYAPGWLVTTRSWARGMLLTHAGSNSTFFAIVWAAPEEGRALFAVTNAATEGAVRATDGAIGLMLGLDAR